jgi:hypothetical protein
MSIAELYDRSRDQSLSEAARDLARRQAEAEAHNAAYYTGPSSSDQRMRQAQREVFCSPCGDEREYCGHSVSFRVGDPSWRRCERHGGRSQTECDVFEVVTE